jgi:hypothetical protein
MPDRSWVRVAVLGAVLAGSGVHTGAAQRGQATCAQAVMEGEVHAGERWARPVGNGLQVMLEPLASGWVLRLLPAEGPRPQHDYAELATPPYQSVSPLLLSTDFSFRAQDAVGWNPRRFRFVPDAEAYRRLLKAYQVYRATQPASAAAQAELVKLVNQMPEATLEIVDARLVPGTADQTSAAAAVASHFLTTAHSLDQPADGRATALGRLNWVRFRVSLDLLPGFRTEPGVALERRACK